MTDREIIHDVVVWCLWVVLVIAFGLGAGFGAGLVLRQALG